MLSRRIFSQTLKNRGVPLYGDHLQRRLDFFNRFNKLEEESINKDGKHSACQKDIRDADLFVNGKEICCSHENPWDIYV
jgi:hypothetical protein